MTNLFQQRRFRFALIPTIAYLLFMILLLNLGHWQLNRANEKQMLFDAFTEAPEVSQTLAEALSYTQSRYQHVRLSGRFVAERQYLLDNMVNTESVPGSHVLTLFETDTGDRIIVNRGWIERRSTAEPRLSLLGFLAVPSEKMTIFGRLDTLKQPGLVLEAEIPDGDYPKTVQFPTFAQLESDLGYSLVKYQLLLDPAEQKEIGFLREWKPHEMGPETHLGYAFQWFALAFTLTIIYLVLSFPKIKQNDPS